MKRVQSLVEVAIKIAQRNDDPDVAIGQDKLARMNYYGSDFRHYLGFAGVTDAAIKSEPSSTGDLVIDAYLAGLAEHLAQQHGLAVPAWCTKDKYFLEKPVFIGWGANMKMIALAETPSAFRRRHLFCGAVQSIEN